MSTKSSDSVVRNPTPVLPKKEILPPPPLIESLGGAPTTSSSKATSEENLDSITEEDPDGGSEGGKKQPEKNGILKKKVAIATITLNGKSKAGSLSSWQDSYVASDSDNSEARPKKTYSTTPLRRSSSLEDTSETMVRRVTEIFQDVFKEERGHWGLKIEYYLSAVGAPIAFSSLWRFPHLIAEYGGGAFLFSYAVLLLLVGIPLYFLESSLGQFSQLGVVHVWRCVPVMQGVGLAMVLLSLITSVYNSQIVAYSVHYFFASFINMDSTVLWGTCDPDWPKCYDVRSNSLCTFLNTTNIGGATTQGCFNYLTPSSRYYWEEKVLRLISLSDVGRTGHIHWDLTLCVAFVWLLTFIFLTKGIKSSGKVALFTGFMPISILIAFFVFSVQKSGAEKGLQEFYYPDWEKLAKSEVWQKAAEQVIFSLCVTYGSILTFNSYKKFNAEIEVGAILLTFSNLFISVMAATTIFAMYGALANTFRIEDVRSIMETEVSALEIIFVFVPEVMARMFPFPHVWSVFFFLMLMCFGLHAQFSLIETCLTTVYDALPKLRRRKYVAAASLILPLFLLSIPLSSSTGLHIHNLIGSSVVGPNLFLIGIFEILSIQCLYGVRRFSKDLKFILRKEPSIFWKVVWIFVAPITLVVLFVFAVIDWRRLVYEGRGEGREWVLYLSWILTLLPLAMIPFTFIFTVIYKLCVKEPVFEPSLCWGPGCARTKEMISEQRRLLREARSQLVGSDNEAYNQS